jgi:arylsulfatase A-like enzyme
MGDDMRFCVTVLFAWLLAATAWAGELPNILWITSEDNGPHLGCYGDAFADTPNIDRLAEKGVIYRHCWSNAPVCAPARTTIISGLYPPSTGGQHMRSMVKLPDGFRMYPELLREAGYYCTNNSKEDYNLAKPKQLWDESSRKAHWKNRQPGQPFFAVFNFTVSHESQIRKRPHTPKHDPGQVYVPAYHPDTSEVRLDWAQYYDKVTEMDTQVGRRLDELQAAGLAENTIVFYYGDHGSGMPRSKRWPYNSGLHVPLVVYIPAKFSHLAPNDYVAGGESNRLVSFVDLAPTVVSLAGVKPPEYYQGHAFLGPYVTQPQPYLHGFRGRMDERYDMVRSVRDERFIYIRNYMPHKIYGQHIAYMFQTPTTQVWKRMYDAGELQPPQTYFWQRKPAEELYDLQQDPDETKNLVSSPEHRAILQRLRSAQQEQARRIRDLGFLPEDEIHRRSGRRAPYEMGHDPAAYPLERIMAAAEMASRMEPAAVGSLRTLLSDEDSAVRYWSAMGLQMRGEDAVKTALDALQQLLDDPSPSVRVVAAQCVAEYGSDAARANALNTLVEAANIQRNGVFSAIAALNALDELGDEAASVRDQIAILPRQDADVQPRMRSYVPRLLETLTGNGE